MAAATVAALYNIIIYKGAQIISFKRINQWQELLFGDIVGGTRHILFK